MEGGRERERKTDLESVCLVTLVAKRKTFGGKNSCWLGKKNYKFYRWGNMLWLDMYYRS